MGAISLQLPESLLEASGRCAEASRVSRAEHIRRAIERMNRETRARLRAGRLADVSRKSIGVNAEFASIERAPGCVAEARHGWPISTPGGARNPGRPDQS